MQQNTRILEAIEKGDLAEFSRLVGRSESLRNDPNAFGSWLHVASEDGQLSIVRYLVENGADVNLRSEPSDGGPIKRAASGGHLHIMEYLLSHGAKLDVTRPERNPMFGAIYNGHADVAKLLLDAGIDPHIVYRSVTGKLKNALSFAQERGEKDIVRLLTKASCRLPIEGVDKPVWEPEEIYQPTAEDKAHEEIIARLAKVMGPVDPLALQEVMPVHGEVHISINVVRPSKGHPLLTLFTTGMSDRPMKVPKGQEDYQYAELMMHLPANWPHPRDKGAGDDTFWPFEWLRQVAYYPHWHDSWLGGKMTIISSDEPPAPLGPNTKQTCLLLVADFDKWSPIVIGKKKVRFYTVIPIYTEERDFEKEHGIAPLLKRLQEHGHTAVVSVDRANVAKASGGKKGSR
jgi:hypothetical protein